MSERFAWIYDKTKQKKIWCADMWSRRAILALQTAVAAITVPNASDATPYMNGTATPGSSRAFSRADHVHPHDSSKQDALSLIQLRAVDSGITAEGVADHESRISSLENAMSGKADALTESQLSAVNSGITAAIIADYESRISALEAKVAALEGGTTT